MSDTDAELEGLRRRDAAVLIAVLYKPEDPRPFGWFRRRFLLRRWGIGKALTRLEARGLVEPGWSIAPARRWPVEVHVTAEGRRVARAAAVMLELEAFGGHAVSARDSD